MAKVDTEILQVIEDAIGEAVAGGTPSTYDASNSLHSATYDKMVESFGGHSEEIVNRLVSGDAAFRTALKTELKGLMGAGTRAHWQMQWF